MHAASFVIFAVDGWVWSFYETCSLVCFSESDICHEIFVAMKMNRMVGPLPAPVLVVNVLSCGDSLKLKKIDNM